MKNILLFILLSALSISSCTLKTETEPPQLIILGLDGMRPDGIENALTPALHQLINEGTSNMRARAVWPTSSGTNWASMLLGCGPDEHGIDANDITLSTRKITPVHIKKNGYSWSIFDQLHLEKPKIRQAAILDWHTIAHYFDTSVPDTIRLTQGTHDVINQILEEALDYHTPFIFAQINQMDFAGHSNGFGSVAYYNAAESLDKEIGRLITTLKEHNRYNNTTIIVMADHGGTGHGHGGKSMEEYNIPFIIKGPGIATGLSTHEPISTFNIPATVARIMHCKPSPYWSGKALNTPFETENKLLTPFVSTPQLICDSITTTASLIHYREINNHSFAEYRIITSTDTTPWNNFEKKIALLHGTTLQARCLRRHTHGITSQYHQPCISNRLLHQPTTLTYSASEQYNNQGNAALTDGLAGGISYSDSEWLGFSGDDIIATIALPHNLNDCDTFFCHMLEHVNAWILPPKQISVYSKTTLGHWQLCGTLKNIQPIHFQQASIRLFKIPLQIKPATELKVIIKNQLLPSWHSGAGNPAWLFIDEAGIM